MLINLPDAKTYGLRKRLGLIGGPLVLLAVLILPPPHSLPLEAWRVGGVGLLMAIWWASEAAPIPVTALLPLILLPLFDAGTITQAAAPYANPVIFLFMGGFMLALAIQRWELHRRVALNIVRLTGTKPSHVIAGFMLATAFLSMWISNTATTVMMLPVGLSVIGIVSGNQRQESPGRDESNFALALLLGIAYSANIGGMATLIGTPPNALMAGFMMEKYGIEIGFAQWMLVGLPLVMVLLPITWVVLTKVAFPSNLKFIAGGQPTVTDQANQLGKLSKEEKLVGAVFLFTALLWLSRSLINGWLPGLALSDAGIAIIGAVLLFLIPTDFRKGEFLLNWEWAKRLPWDVLILFGGGLSLASAISNTGLDLWIGAALTGLSIWPLLGIILVITSVIVFLTELTSNTATAATFLPVVASVAVGIDQSPFLLVVPAALAASCAFMMPVATPPNAVVYGSGLVSIPQMMRAGIIINLVSIIVITALAYTVVVAVFGV